MRERMLRHGHWWMLLLAWAGAVVGALAGERQRWDDDWKFFLGDDPAAAQPEFDDRGWRTINLPHDWSIEGKTAADAPSAGGGGFFPTGVGWYRREFIVANRDAGEQWEIEFEGVYRDAEVWINGASLGRRPAGYATFFHALTAHLQPGRNVIAVRVDNSGQPNSRWYTGSGIYRHVWLHRRSPVSLRPWGVSVRTETLTGAEATLRIETTVQNPTKGAVKGEVEIQIVDAEGRVVAESTVPASMVAEGEATVVTQVRVANPRAWTPETPALYQAMVQVRVGGQVKDRAETSFGIRTVRVSAERGFELNGRMLELVGSNVHSEHGPLGAASFDRAEERKVELLKAAGFNAVRTAHNPPAPAFLEACDRLGLLVIEEAFDGWARAKNKQDYGQFFREWWQRDLDAMVLRDRNHPSVVMWSIGNEMFERTSASGRQIAQELTARIRELDPTRPISAGVNGAGKNGQWSQLDPLFATLDVAGYNYEMEQAPADHARLPQRVIMAAESYQVEPFAMWRATQENAHVIGDFVWSGMDYLGEAGIGRIFLPDEPVLKHWEGNHFPWHGAACGDLDLLGVRKPISHYRNIVWGRGETLYAAVLKPTPDGRPWNLSPWALPPLEAKWTWPGHQGKLLTVEVYSRHDAVRLSLNGVVLGEKPTTAAQEFKAIFEVPYAAGELKAVGLRGGVEVEEFELKTAGETKTLALNADRAMVRADGQDLVFVMVEARDVAGVFQPEATDLVGFSVSGPAEIIAVGNSDLTSEDSYQANPRRLHQGRAQVVLRTTKEAGEIVLTAQAAGLATATVVVRAK